MIEAERWVCDSDTKADYCIRKIKEEQKEIARLEKLAKAEINEIEQRLIDAKKASESTIGFFTGAVREYFDSVPHKWNKSRTKETYKLLSGSLVRSEPSKKIAHDDEKLIRWLEENEKNEFVKVKKEVAWGEFKKTLSIIDDCIIDTDGQMVDCLTIEDVPEEFTIK